MRYLFVLLFPIIAFGQIIEVSTFDEVLPHIRKDSLVIFDIDNTLMEPTQELGNDQWFRHRVKVHQQKGLNQEKAIDKAVEEWMSVQCITTMQLVEPKIDEKVKKLQDDGIDIIGLTTRGFGMATRTLHQLASLDIDLKTTAPYSEEFIFENGRQCLFRGGILFTANTHKGDALEKFLAHTKYKPKHIVFVNDKHSHLLPVDETCETLGHPFIGLRYGYLDDKVENFDPKISQMQWDHFRLILSDEEANRLIVED